MSVCTKKSDFLCANSIWPPDSHQKDKSGKHKGNEINGFLKDYIRYEKENELQKNRKQD